MTSAPAREWWTAGEIADAALPDLPTTKRRVNAMAERLDWAGRQGRARRRKGQGGGWEYHWTLLPSRAQALLLAQAARTAEPASKGAQPARPSRDEAWQRPGASFLVSCLHGELPGGGSGLLSGVANGREVRLSGLVIRRGCFLSWQYGTNPVRYAFHQLAEGLTADGTGVMGWAEVAPGVRPGHSIDATVQVGVPRLEAVMVPGSLRPGRARNTMAEGLAFDWQQTLR